MTEEETNTSHMTTDDLSALRILLHNVQGLSVVSSTSELIQKESED